MRMTLTMALVVALAGCGSSGSSSQAGTGGTAGGASSTSGAAGIGGAAGAGGASACAPVLSTTTAAAGTMSWKDNGSLQCAFVVLAVRTTATLADTIEIDAVTASTGTAPNLGVDIALSSYSGLLGGTYHCQPGNGSQADVMFEVLGQKTSGFAAMSDCTVTIDFSTDSTGAQRAHGTFSGTVTGTGGTDTVTDGTFDLSVTVNGG